MTTFTHDDPLTAEQRKRTLAALTETCESLEKAMRFMPQNRDAVLIGQLEAHIAKLEKMLAAK